MHRFFPIMTFLVLLLLIIGPAWASEPLAKIGRMDAQDIAASLLEIPAGYKLRTTSFRIDGTGMKVWTFNWDTNVKNNEGQIWIEVDADSGKVRSFIRWSVKYAGKKTIEYQDALMYAQDFARQMEPEKFEQVVLQTASNSGGIDMDYHFNFLRIANGYPYRDNAIHITVSRTTGEILSYVCNWDEVTLPVPQKVITGKEAKESFYSKVGVELKYIRVLYDEAIYKQKMQADGTITVPPREEPPSVNYLVYAPRSNNTPVYVDAYSGEILDTNGQPLLLQIRDNKPLGLAEGSKPRKEVDLDAAMAIARDTANLPDSAKLNYVNYSETSDGLNPPIWNFSWATKNDQGWQVSVGVNARTGAVTNIASWRTGVHTEVNGPKVNVDQAKQIAIDFIEKIAPDKLDQLTYQDNINLAKMPEIPAEGYDMRFTRLVNGIPYPDHGVTVGVGLDGTVLRFWSNWEEMDFPAPTGLISIEKAKEILANEMGFELGYTRIYKPDGTYDVKLIYKVNNYDRFVDAETGKIKASYGYPVLIEKIAPDVVGHWAQKDFEKLAGQQIIDLRQKDFKPNEAISRGELTKMIVRALDLNPYYPETPTFADVNKMSTEYGYIEAASKAGIIKGNGDRFMSEAKITREQLAVILVKALGVKIVKDTGVLTDYKDAGDIGNWAKYAVATTTREGLFIGDTGKFRPKDNVTRAQASVLVARLLEKLS